MKKTLKQIFSAFMASVMIFAAFSMGALAVSPNEFDDAKLATENFTVNFISDNQTVYYKFIPQEDGFYFLSGNDISLLSVVLFDSERNELDSAYPFDDIDSYGLLANLTAGDTYYYSIEASLFDYFPTSTDISIEYFGTLDSSEILQMPMKLKYVFDYDAFFSEKDDTSYIYINLSGFGLNIKFSGGNEFDLWNNDVRKMLNIVYSDVALGTVTVSLENSGIVFASYSVEIIENPVSSIEVVKLPDKAEYTNFMDGYVYYDSREFYFDPYYNYDGLEVKVNYTDGTSRICTFSDDSSYFYFDDGSYMFIGRYTFSGVGTSEVRVSYLDHEATFNLKIKEASSWYILLRKVLAFADWIVDNLSFLF